ncbi:hypothetical protein ACF3M1_12295 [Luteimonas sp. WGS1318]|uniref:hypothetical protein n=1 Tax=Luteimonas sp. WGS1318 TaxID=3366815 RepID=UPI00372D0CC9
MSRALIFMSVPLLLVLASAPAASQQLQRPQPAPSPAATPSSTPAPTVVPATPTQRARQPAPIPQSGLARPTTGPPSPVQPLTPTTPTQVRDAQGRVVPGAREIVPGRARDPATGQEFRTDPVPRPR